MTTIAAAARDLLRRIAEAQRAEPVEVVIDALTADVLPESVTGKALFILDSLAANGWEVTKTSARSTADWPGGASGGTAAAVDAPPASYRPTKEEAACCVATRDEYGRLCIGYCSPTCRRRPLTPAAILAELRGPLGGYSSSARQAADLAPPPAGPAPGAVR